jgi:hypothetical protein
MSQKKGVVYELRLALTRLLLWASYYVSPFATRNEYRDKFAQAWLDDPAISIP